MKNSTASRRGLVASVALAVATLVVAACGSSASGGGQGGAVKIGVAVALTGPNASLMGVGADVANAWQHYAAKQGGLAGRPVEIVVQDTKSDPAAGVATAKELVQRDKVSAMIVLDAVAEKPIVSYLQTTNVPLLGEVYGHDVQGKLPNVFAVTTAQEFYQPAGATTAKAFGAKSLGNIFCAESPLCASSMDVYKRTTNSIGLTYGGGAKVSASAPDYTAECLQLLGARVDEIILDVAPATAARIAQACLRQGFTGVFGATSAVFNVSILSGVAGATFVGPLNAFPWWIDTPAVQTFHDAVKAYKPDAAYQTPVATAAWATLEVLRKALANEKGEVSAATVTAALRKVKGETLDGLLPQPIDFTGGDVAPAVRCYWMASYKAGDATPSLIRAQGTSGNGQTGDLASECSTSSS